MVFSHFCGDCRISQLKNLAGREMFPRPNGQQAFLFSYAALPLGVGRCLMPLSCASPGFGHRQQEGA
jgi:hypothetical protein